MCADIDLLNFRVKNLVRCNLSSKENLDGVIAIDDGASEALWQI